MHSTRFTHSSLPALEEVMLWRNDLVPEEHPLAAMLKFAGIISVGVGDAMAAIVGSSLGRFRWPGTKRTIEGSLAAGGACQ